MTEVSVCESTVWTHLHVPHGCFPGEVELQRRDDLAFLSIISGRSLGIRSRYGGLETSRAPSGSSSPLRSTTP
jgi:hypothetical protein